MPLVVFPVATTKEGAPTFSDDFGAPRTGHPHQGIDIFAAEGTPVLAPDDGDLTLTLDGAPGGSGCPPPLSFHLQAKDAFYFGTHLSAWPSGGKEGDRIAVKAGEIIGFVGHGGNACTTPPHLHFEQHLSGVAVDPFAALQRAEHVTIDHGTVDPSPKALTIAFGAKAIQAAYRRAHGADAKGDALVFPLAQAIAEGTFGETFVGSNNFGAVHATQRFHDAHKDEPGFGFLAHLESGGVGFYVGALAIFPSALLGAAEFLGIVEGVLSRAGSSLDDVQTLEDYARALYVAGYYEGKHTADVTPLARRRQAFADGAQTADDDANVLDYVTAMSASEKAARAGIAGASGDPRDPASVSVGPPFCDLALRLTPGRQFAPHTIDHARQLLGKNADAAPPGAFSLPETISAPDGPGVWLFGANKPAPSPAPEPPTPRTVERSSTDSLLALAGTVLLAGAVLVVPAILAEREGETAP